MIETLKKHKTLIIRLVWLALGAIPALLLWRKIGQFGDKTVIWKIHRLFYVANTGDYPLDYRHHPLFQSQTYPGRRS